MYFKELRSLIEHFNCSAYDRKDDCSFYKSLYCWASIDILLTNGYLTLLQDDEDSESAKNRHPEATRQRNDPETPTWPRWYQRVHTAAVAATTPSVA